MAVFVLGFVVWVGLIVVGVAVTGDAQAGIQYRALGL